MAVDQRAPEDIAHRSLRWYSTLERTYAHASAYVHAVRISNQTRTHAGGRRAVERLFDRLGIEVERPVSVLRVCTSSCAWQKGRNMGFCSQYIRIAASFVRPLLRPCAPHQWALFVCPDSVRN